MRIAKNVKIGVKIFFQNFEEKCLIIILRPKWAILGVKWSFGGFIKSYVAISKIGLVPPPLTGDISGLKESVITPILKKAFLDMNIFKNYRPIVTLQFLSKVIEKVVLKRLNRHMTTNNLHSSNQFGYKKDQRDILLIASSMIKNTMVRIKTNRRSQAEL